MRKQRTAREKAVVRAIHLTSPLVTLDTKEPLTAPSGTGEDGLKKLDMNLRLGLTMGLTLTNFLSTKLRVRGFKEFVC